MKQAIFTAVDNGIDGRDKSRIVFASINEAERDEWIATHPSGAWYRPDDIVKDLEKEAISARHFLNGLQLLALGMEQEQPKKKKKLKA